MDIESPFSIFWRAIFEFIRLIFFTRINVWNFVHVINLKVMRADRIVIFLALAMMSCQKDGMNPVTGIDYEYGRGLSHGKIVLGNRLENPYKTENITKALASLYPTKAGRVEVKPTDFYVRFLPENKQECDELKSLGIDLLDHPLDYAIAVDGDWYHDPQVPEGDVTWQYGVVPVDFDFPDIRYEIIDECYINKESSQTKSDGIDWDAVERESYILTGNESYLSDVLTKGSEKVSPSGRITIVDEHANGGKPFGVAGVRVSCNTFVKFDKCQTDRDGYYTMSKKFSSDLRYRLVFQNEKGFAIGLNLILVPASVSTLGKSGPGGVNVTVTKESDDKLYKRCVVNNAAYEYYSRCAEDDLNLALPPSDLRLWIFSSMNASSCMMTHHGAILSNDLISGFLGHYASLIQFLLPDITLGISNDNDYRSIYSEVCHEIAHASHFAKVGTGYWNEYIWYVVESYIKSGGLAYGDGTGSRSGYCELGEMWAYYLESKMYKDRYGGSFPTFGTSFWFYPQIFRYLDERGIAASDIFSVLNSDVKDRVALEKALIEAFPLKKSIISQVFSRY